MAISVYLLGGEHAQIDDNGDAKTGYTTGDTYIPLVCGRIEYKLQRKPVSLPIPVFGITAVIDYNIRQQYVTLSEIILADGTNGSSIFGKVSPGGTKGWIVNGRTYTQGGTPNLNNKEVQRALLTRVVGGSFRSEAQRSPLFNRLVWGAPSDSDGPIDANFKEVGVGGLNGELAKIFWGEAKVTDFTAVQIGGEPTKYECTLDVELASGGSGTPSSIKG